MGGGNVACAVFARGQGRTNQLKLGIWDGGVVLRWVERPAEEELWGELDADLV